MIKSFATPTTLLVKCVGLVLSVSAGTWNYRGKNMHSNLQHRT